LFDMDRTLILLTDAYRVSYGEGIRRVYGVEAEMNPARYAGRTQPEIVRMLVAEQGVPPEVIEAKLSQCFDVQSEVTLSLLEPDLRPRLFPGVAELLTTMHARGCALGLVTGTVTAVAREAMQRAGLWECFCITALGEEGPDRVTLLRLAMQRAVADCGFTGSVKNVVVVGDTPYDVAAGKAIGARTVAVANGHHSLETLRAAGPDALLPDFSDLEASLRALWVE